MTRWMVVAESGHRIPVTAPFEAEAIAIARRRWISFGIDTGVIAARPIDERAPKLDLERRAARDPIPLPPESQAELVAPRGPITDPEELDAAIERAKQPPVPLPVAEDESEEVLKHCSRCGHAGHNARTCLVRHRSPAAQAVRQIRGARQSQRLPEPEDVDPIERTIVRFRPEGPSRAPAGLNCGPLPLRPPGGRP